MIALKISSGILICSLITFAVRTTWYGPRLAPPGTIEHGAEPRPDTPAVRAAMEKKMNTIQAAEQTLEKARAKLQIAQHQLEASKLRYEMAEHHKAADYERYHRQMELVSQIGPSIAAAGGHSPEVNPPDFNLPFEVERTKREWEIAKHTYEAEESTFQAAENEYQLTVQRAELEYQAVFKRGTPEGTSSTRR